MPISLPSPVKKRFRDHPKRSVFLVILVIAGIYWLATAVFSGDKTRLEQTVVVTRGDIENSIGSLGTLEPKEYVDVGTQVSGLLDKLLVEIGDTVEKGQLLAEIDPTVYESRVRNARSTLANLDAQIKLQRAELELAKIRAQRNLNLYEQNAVSRDVMLASETEVAVTEARIQSLLAQMDAAQASLDGDIANLGYTKIFAPISGTVVNSSAIEGQTINASQTAPTIVRIADLDTMTVRAQVSEADVVKIQPGMPVYFTTLGMPNRRWRAEVRKVLPTPEIINNVVLYNVLVDVDNSDRALMTSMTTQVFFVRDHAEDALVIPASALRNPPADIRKTVQGSGKESTAFVLLKGQDGNEWRRITLGVRSRTEVQVVKGLSEGDVLVTGLAAASDINREGGLPRGRFR